MSLVVPHSTPCPSIYLTPQAASATYYNVRWQYCPSSHHRVARCKNPIIHQYKWKGKKVISQEKGWKEE
ncbi:hypothetical protein IC582_023930 [Cucumis melo]